MFKKLLIANRGEIACRVIRTARRLGMSTVAVYSDADQDALHTHLADHAFRIGPAPAPESYLDGAAILRIARQSEADAIHPGYGFLAEDARFARACARQSMVFIGPPPGAIRLMGEKTAALQRMREAEVPTLPGSIPTEQSDSALRAAAVRIGYPVLIKPCRGGGGKGMRLVRDDAEFLAAAAAARREAGAAFGNDTLLVEKYLEGARHIEVQIFADRAGNAVHLFERDCSIQRRQQKVIEECPAPGLPAAVREALYAAALRASSAIEYLGAGTVEFLVEDRKQPKFYFLEMNTRLQVEHPVTEQVTGQDLVEWQLRVASGEPLPCPQSALSRTGHAIEARVYAETPERGFLPVIGRIRALELPEEEPGLRIDAGVSVGEEISIHYDPLLLKIIASGADRGQAIARLVRALGDCTIAGPPTNLGFLTRVLSHPAYLAQRFNTSFIPEHLSALLTDSKQPSDEILALSVLYLLLTRDRAAEQCARRSSDPHSPWHTRSAWRLNTFGREQLAFAGDGETVHVVVEHRGDRYRLVLPGGTREARARLELDGTIVARIDDHNLSARIARDADRLTVRCAGACHELHLATPLARPRALTLGRSRVIAPMPGKILVRNVQNGDMVREGDPLLVLEAMKMEHTISAPSGGKVVDVKFKPGDVVEADVELLVLESQSSPASFESSSSRSSSKTSVSHARRRRRS